MNAKRNRIVIDLNQPYRGRAAPKSRQRTGRAGRVLGIIAIVLAIVIVGVAAGAYFWWQHYKAQPAYTLALLVDAAQRNDNEEVDRILDMDKVTDNFVADVRVRVTSGNSSPIGNFLPSQVDQAVALIRPKLKDTLQAALPTEIQRVSEPAKGKPLIVVALAVPYFVNIKQDRNCATGDIKTNNEQIQLIMEPDQNNWRIVSIKDDRLAGIIAEASRKGLSTRGNQLQDEVQRQLQRLMPSASP